MLERCHYVAVTFYERPPIHNYILNALDALHLMVIHYIRNNCSRASSSGSGDCASTVIAVEYYVLTYKAYGNTSWFFLSLFKGQIKLKLVN